MNSKNRKWLRAIALFVVTAAFALPLTGCGGSGGGGGTSTPAGLSTGTFLDSAVSGINYKTETQSGQTDASGHFSYYAGENVTFSVGAANLPTVPANVTVTPLDLAKTTDLNNQVAVNITVFLQSLNTNADPTRGIAIAPQAHTAATTQIDFTASSTTFSANTDLQKLIKNAGSAKASLVDEASAKAHLKSTLNGSNGAPKINIAPVAEAGVGQSVTVGATVTLNGAESRDANSDSLTYSWAFVSKATGSSAALTNPTSVRPTFVPDVAGDYVVSLTVNDGSLSSPADTVTIAAAAAVKTAVANAGTAQSIKVGATVALNGSGSSDPAGNPITYSWSLISKPTSSTATLTNPTTMAPTFVADIAGSFVVGLTVNNGKANSPLATVTITSSSASSPAPTTNGSSSSPYLESDLVAAGNLNPNGFVKSTASGKIYDLRWGTLDAPTTLSNTDTVTVTVQTQGDATLAYRRLDGATGTLKVAGAFNTSSSTNTSTLAIQSKWITPSVLTAWAAGLDGKGVGVAVVDDFTVQDTSEFHTIPLPTRICANITAGGSTVYYCVTTDFLIYTMTHGQQVAAIISGFSTSGKALWYSSGPYYHPTTGVLLGTLSTYQPLTLSRSTPLYGTAYGASATTRRDDYLDYQKNTNGLFNQLQIWGAGTDATSLGYQGAKVVNLSLGGSSTNPVANTRYASVELPYANASTVPDAVFVKAAGNAPPGKGPCIISNTNCDVENTVFYTTTNFKSKTLIVGALTADGGTIAPYSNLAGTYSDRFVVADGRGYQNSGGTFDQGTSFAAPRVAGYVAILRQKYPNLNAADAASIILATAKWNTAWGTKNATTQAIYGQGEADLSRALAAIGSLP